MAKGKIKSLEDLKSALKDFEGNEDIIEFVVESIESEKNKGISEKRRANDEAKGLRAYKKAMEALGYDKETDLDEYVDAITEKIEAVGDIDPDENKSMQKELKKLRRDFEKAQNSLNEERERATKIKQDADRKALTSKITDTIRDRVYGADLVAETLINNGRVALEDDGTVVWIDGEDRGSFDDGIKTYIESRSDIVKNGQKGGAGSPPVNGPSNKKYTVEQVQGMSKDEVRANLSEIKESLGFKK